MALIPITKEDRKRDTAIRCADFAVATRNTFVCANPLCGAFVARHHANKPKLPDCITGEDLALRDDCHR
jgi:hypothetical protein